MQENMTADVVSDIPTDPRLFQLWLNGQHWSVLWPVDLVSAAIKAGLALVDRSDPRWETDYEYRKPRKANWQAFTTAYADHVGAR